MLPEEIEKLAADNSELPDGLTSPEQLLFLKLRSLYFLFRNRGIQKDAAKLEKTNIYKQFAQDELNWKCWQASLERQRKLSFMIQEIRKCECETCKKVLRIEEGL